MVGSTQNSVPYEISGNGPYAIPFRYDSASWIVATVTDADGETTTLQMTTEYTLGGNGPQQAGTLTLVGDWPTDYILTIWRETPGTNSLDLDAGPIPHNSLEGQLDRLAMASADTVRPRQWFSLSGLVTRMIAVVEELIANGPGGGGGGGGGSTAWSAIVGKPTAFPPIIGAGEDQAVAGNDARLTNSRTPTAHEHNPEDIDGFNEAAVQAVHDSTFPLLNLAAGEDGRLEHGVLTDFSPPSFYFQFKESGNPLDNVFVQFQFGPHGYFIHATNLSQPRIFLLPDASGTLLLTNAVNGKIPGSYANDAAAAAADVPIGFPYHTAGAVKVRLA